MSSKKVDRRIRRTRRFLKQGLCNLMKEKPLRNITIQDITDNVDLNRSTFYLHYSDIEDLLEKTENEFIDGLNEVVEELQYNLSKKNIDVEKELEEFKNYLNKTLESTFEFLLDNYDLSYILFNHSDSAFMEKFAAIMIQKSIDIEKRFLQETDEVFLEYSGAFNIFGTIGVIKKWLNSENRIPPKDLANAMVNFLIFDTVKH